MLSVASIDKLKVSKDPEPEGGARRQRPLPHRPEERPQSWAGRYRDGDRVVKITLGPYDKNGDHEDPKVGDPLSVHSARELWSKIKKQRNRGVDPVAERKAARRRIEIDRADKSKTTFLRLARDWIEHEQRPTNRTWRRVARVLGLVYHEDKEPYVLPGSIAAQWSSTPVSEIGSDDVFKVIDASYRSGVPGQVVRKAEPSKSRRLRVIKVLVPLFKYLRDERRLVTGEALAGVPVAKKNGDKTTRDRVLSDVELRSRWLKAEGLHPSYRDIVRLLILTGQRLSDVAGMRRSEIEGDVWTIPAERYKSKRDQTVFLPVTALSLVAGATSTRISSFPVGAARPYRAGRSSRRGSTAWWASTTGSFTIFAGPLPPGSRALASRGR